MKIGFIWQCPYPWDIRLEKIIKACTQNGHQVSLLCKGKRPLPVSENSDGIEIHRVYAPGVFKSRAWAKAATFPLFFNPVWIAAVAGFLKQQKLDLVVVRDLPLAMLVAVLGKLYHTPVVLDMAENYPAALTAYKNPLYKPFLVGNAWLPRQYEKASVKLLDHTFVVTDEQAQRLEAMGVDSSKLTVVGNTPEPEVFAYVPEKGVRSTPVANGRSANLLFVGKLDAHRGVELLVRALPDLVREFPDLTLTLVGNGTERLRIEQTAVALGVASKVDFPGWVEFSKIWGYIDHSTVCLIPHLRSEHTDTTLPNKLFDYMALGKPVVASDCAPMERVIRETDCGLTFQSGNVKGLQAALRAMLSNANARSIKGQNGREAVQQKYNWDVDREVFLKVIEGVPSRVLA